ncbi:MAG: alpha amylase C-terminal domain-containing protein, partial [Clostridium sp.]
FHIDGFRFDLMGLHDIETIREIRRELDKLDKSILVYGEGWKGGYSPLPDKESALKYNVTKFELDQIACFSDEIRDGVKGDVFNSKSPGFVNGGMGFGETIKAGVVACTKHHQVDYSNVIYSDKPWANEPYQTITYASAHDNYTLWDKLQLSVQDDLKDKEDKLIKMNKLVAAIILTSQGISFIHSGEEILRTKVDIDGKLVENSYNYPDFTNKFDWKRKEEYEDIFKYYAGLIKLRKSCSEFRLGTSKEIQDKIKFYNIDKNNDIIAYSIDEKVFVVYNSKDKDVEVAIPNGSWKVVVNEDTAGVDTIKIIDNKKVVVNGISALVLIKC